MKSEPNFFGKDGFCWFVGVVEDRQDPEKLGRVRVRALGYHTSDKQLLPVCKLPWSPVMQHPNNAAMNGFGHSNTGILEGSWCLGFFKDGSSAQEPIVMGVIPGIPFQPPQPCIGFFDPSLPFHNFNTAPRKINYRYYPNTGVGAQLGEESSSSLYPRQLHPWGCRMTPEPEADTNRLARGELTDDTVIGVKRRQRDVNIPISFAHTVPTRQWNEPLSTYNAVYPYNHVFESESGHIWEVDDTPGAERLHIYHRSGTFIEIQGGLSGDWVCKVVGKKFEITMENAYSHYQNTLNVTVDGETNIYVRQTCNLQVDGDLNVHVQGDYTEKVKGNYFTDIGGSRVVRIAGNDELDVIHSQTSTAGSMTHSAGGTFDIIAGGTINESAGGVLNLGAGIKVAVVPTAPGGPVLDPLGVTGPEIPPFPIPTNWTESRNESGVQPVPEPPNPLDPDPAVCPNQTDC